MPSVQGRRISRCGREERDPRRSHQDHEGRLVTIAAHMSEAEFQRIVLNYASECGWRVWHFHDSRRQVKHQLVGDVAARGFPDLNACHPSRGLFYAELKAEKGRLTGHQRVALDQLAVTARSMAMNGANTPKLRVHVWRPSDMPDVILPLLAKGEGPVVHGW